MMNVGRLELSFSTHHSALIIPHSFAPSLTVGLPPKHPRAAKRQMSKYTRREFIKAGLAAGFALRAAGASPQLPGTEPVSLAGEWRFALDSEDAGVKEEWFGQYLTGRITLPGILQAQGYGDEISTD